MFGERKNFAPKFQLVHLSSKNPGLSAAQTWRFEPPICYCCLVLLNLVFVYLLFAYLFVRLLSLFRLVVCLFFSLFICCFGLFVCIVWFVFFLVWRFVAEVFVMRVVCLSCLVDFVCYLQVLFDFIFGIHICLLQVCCLKLLCFV